MIHWIMPRPNKVNCLYRSQPLDTVPSERSLADRMFRRIRRDHVPDFPEERAGAVCWLMQKSLK